MAAKAASTQNAAGARNLHFVLKVGNRTAAVDFFQTLGMFALRHEEFEEGCKAACNGPYDGQWSKTMIGYGPEDAHFVLELTYTYTVKQYELGNDLRHIAIRRRAAYDALKAKGLGSATKVGGADALEVEAPGGYRFVVVGEDAGGPCPFSEVALHVADLGKSVAFWSGFLGFPLQQQSEAEAVLQPGGESGCLLRLVQLPAGTQMNRGTAYGRIAFACPGQQLEALQSDVLAAGYTIHTPYVSLDTPGKATVQVVILQDPDGHEICFVGDEGFRSLSQLDPQGPSLLAAAVEADKSEEWAAKAAAREAAMAAKGV